MDGTRIKAVNNKDRNFTRASLAKFIKAADATLDDYLQRLDKSDAVERGTGGSRVRDLPEKIAALRKRRERYKSMLAELERTGESQISLTDPDSRAMAAHTRVAVGYNVQIAVDAKHKLIVEQQVTNQVVDMGLLTETAAAAKEVLGGMRPARPPVSILMCRARSAVPLSGKACSARMSSATTRPATATSVRQARFCNPIRHRCCAG